MLAGVGLLASAWGVPLHSLDLPTLLHTAETPKKRSSGLGYAFLENRNISSTCINADPTTSDCDPYLVHTSSGETSPT